MASRARRIDEEKAFSLAMHDVSRQFIRDLTSLGFTRAFPSTSWSTCAIHGASPAYIRELNGLGYEHLAVDDS